VSSRYYAYELLDREDNEVLVYHWHPEGASGITYPHLHLSSQVSPIALAPIHPNRVPATVDYDELHIPTGRVLVEDLVRMLIERLDVRPLRRDWQAVLGANATASRADQSW
jgi:hypothetical protein